MEGFFVCQEATKMPTPFSKFSRLCQRLQATSRKLEKTSVLSDFLRSLEADELETGAHFLLGKIFPDHDARTLNVSWQTIQKMSRDLKTTPVTDGGMTLSEVRKSFVDIAETSGKGSRKKIEALLHALFERIGEHDRQYLMRIIFGEMRIGVAEGLLLEGIARAAGVPLALVRRANMVRGDPGEVARIALTEGQDALEKIDIVLFRPVQPMLAELAGEFDKVFASHGGKTALEFKFDGARVQIHKKQQEIRIFSRHLTDVTASLPDLTDTIRKGLSSDAIIVEGEVLAVDSEGRPLPFQELMRRFRRVHDIESAMRDVPIRLHLFDILYANGASVVGKPYVARIALLDTLCRQDMLVQRVITDNRNEAEAFLQESQKLGHEGLMAKRLDSDYAPGSRGKKWFKIKPSETLDLAVIAADWGSGRRKGWLSNYHLTARDPATGAFLNLGKTFKGLTDEQFKWMTQRLLDLKTEEDGYTVRVRPEIVVEVAYNEIQRSPHYDSKFALRFARVKRIRTDKGVEQVDTIERVRRLYEKQFERKGRAGKKNED